MTIDFDIIDTSEEVDMDLESIPIHNHDERYYTETETNALLALKQNVVPDLSTIRSGAALGASAYQKPGTGIPSSDMSSAVQASLGKADTALQAQDIVGKVDKTSGASKVYGTDANGNQTTYDKESFGHVDDVTQNGVSIVANKIAAIVLETGLASDSNNSATVTAIRAFVNSSINAVAAYYDTADANGNAFATKAALDAGPWYYAGQQRTPTTNDYAIVTADETHGGNTARYSYQGNQWAFQYTFNMSFTQGQIDALNSGINSGKVGGYDSHVANTNVHVTSQNKSDWEAKSVVSVAASGTATSEVQYITINGTESKLAGGTKVIWRTY